MSVSFHGPAHALQLLGLGHRLLVNPLLQATSIYSIYSIYSFYSIYRF